MKSINRSKRDRAARLKKPEFAMTGVVIGLLAGWLAGFITEILTQQKMIVMLVGGLAGASLGGLFEAIRYWWRTRRFQALQQKNR